MTEKLISLAARDIRKKEAGSTELISGCLILIITIVVMAMISMNTMGNIKKMDDQSDVSTIMRKYIIRMETYGYLTDEDKEALIGELTDLGVRNIDLSGTTMSEVEYGEVIYLYVKGQIEEKVFDLNGLFDGGWNNTVYEIDKKISSTSQQ